MWIYDIPYARAPYPQSKCVCRNSLRILNRSLSTRWQSLFLFAFSPLRFSHVQNMPLYKKCLLKRNQFIRECLYLRTYICLFAPSILVCENLLKIAKVYEKLVIWCTRYKFSSQVFFCLNLWKRLNQKANEIRFFHTKPNNKISDNREK